MRKSREIDDEFSSPISAIVIPCAGKKKLRPDRGATALILPRASQRELEAEWLRLVRELRPTAEASRLYGGRSFGLGRDAAHRFRADLYIVSAGLGFVPGERRVPPYGLTVSGRGPESVAAHAVGGFDSADWWHAVASGPYSTRIDECLGARGTGLVLIALTKPYAEMFGAALADALGNAAERVRLFGRGLSGHVPAALEPLIMPYDDRLDVLLPGTRTDFSVRALSHFANNVAANRGTFAEHRELVSAAMACVTPPARVERPRLPDDAIVALIQEHLKTTSGIGRTLRRLRDEDAIACEQARFTRLYRIAAAQGARS